MGDSDVMRKAKELDRGLSVLENAYRKAEEGNLGIATQLGERQGERAIDAQAERLELASFSPDELKEAEEALRVERREAAEAALEEKDMLLMKAEAAKFYKEGKGGMSKEDFWKWWKTYCSSTRLTAGRAGVCANELEKAVDVQEDIKVRAREQLKLQLEAEEQAHKAEEQGGGRKARTRRSRKARRSRARRSRARTRRSRKAHRSRARGSH